MTAWQTRSAALGAIAVALALAVLAARTGERESARAGRPEGADEKRWQAVAPGRVEPAVYIDAKLAMLDEGTRAATLGAIVALADVADGGPEALANRLATPEFLMLRALACEAFYSDFLAPGAEGPSAWEAIDFRFPLASQIQHDWSFLGIPR